MDKSTRRILLTHPYSWPFVHRGAEREVHGVGSGLVAAGHDVRLLSSRPDGLLSRSTVDGLRVRNVRVLRPGPLARRGLSETAAFAATVAAGVVATRVDVVHAFHYADAVAASRVLRLRPASRRPPVVLKLTGTVEEGRLGELRVEAALFRRAVAEADEVWCNSVYAQEAMAWCGREMRLVPAGLDRDAFRPGDRAPVPTVLVTSAPGDPRKRLVDLLEAWPAIADAAPGARLRVAGLAPPQVQQALRAQLPAQHREDVDFLGVLSGTELAREYARAWALAAPAVHEALGLTVLEALASGTPVAAAASGAHPELLAAGAGSLATPLDPADLARAVVECLALAEHPDTSARCRALSAPYSWDRVLHTTTDRYSALLEARS